MFKFLSVIPYLQFKPFETETSEGRTKERHRRALLTLLANVLSKGIGFVVMIVSLRIALPYLGKERFGIMATITSLAMLLTFLDLGIGNGLVSQVARLRTVRDNDSLARLIGNALFILGIIGAIAAVVLCVLSIYSPLAWAFKGARLPVLTEARSTLTVFGILFGLSVPLGAVQRIFAGLQEGYTAQLITAALSVIGLILLYFLPYMGAGIPAFLLVTYGMQVLAGLVMLWMLMVRRLVACPNYLVFSDRETISLLKTGGLFFILQIGGVIGWGADNLIISTMLGAAEVTQLVVVQRMFMLVSVPLSMINGPLWAAYADAASRGDKDYIHITFKRSMLLTPTLAIIVGMLIFSVYGFLASLITKGTVSLTSSFVLLYAFWSVLDSAGNAFAMFVNGMHVVRPQVVVVILFVMVSIPLKIFLLSKFGLAGLVSGTILAYMFTIILPYATVFKRTITNSVNMAILNR